MSLLVAKDIDVAFRSGDQDIVMLRDLSFSVGAGEVLGIIGETGAGKSMVARMISRLLPPNFRVSGGSL
ncbi:MAG: ATP-binding cassette domain-containing protein, partial [Alphaproteobacteria bacterium]